MLRTAAVLSKNGFPNPRFVNVGYATTALRCYAKQNKPQPSHLQQPPFNRHGSDAHRSQADLRRAKLDSISAKVHQSQERLGNRRNEVTNVKKVLADHASPTETFSSPNLASPHHASAQYAASLNEDTSHQSSVPPKTSSHISQEAEERAPTQPLPDLTQGIPSTLDAELEDKSGKADVRSLNITEDPDVGEEKGELPKTAYVSSLERKQRRLARILYAFLLANALGATIWLGRNWEDDEQEKKHPSAPSGWGFALFYDRAKARLAETLDYYNEPAFPKLLPSPDPTWARPYTLVVSLDDLLVHGEWSREHGWRMAKRPGVDYFLRYLSSYYELVVWTSQPSMLATNIIQKLDPFRIIMWPLFREATRYQNGSYIKDLNYLNRDPSKVIILDTDALHTRNQPDNAIIIPPWKSDPNNKELINLIPFLEYCATMDFKDLREVLKSFQSEDIPREYARREAMMREKQQKAMAEHLKKRGKTGGGFMSALTGPSQTQLIGPDGTPLPSLSEAMAQGKTYQDYVRERGQKQYEMLEKQIKENGDKWLKEMADEEKKANDEAMQGMKKSATSWIPFVGMGSAPKAEDGKNG